MPVDGNTKHKSSYRAEFISILAALITIKQITSKMTSTDQLTGTIWCDNESLLRRINKFREGHLYSIKHATEDEYNIIHEIAIIKTSLKFKISLRWVKGHQKKPTTLEERLNRVADNLANDHYNLLTSQQSQENPPYMPNQEIQISFRGTAYMSRVTKEASRNYHGYKT